MPLPSFRTIEELGKFGLSSKAMAQAEKQLGKEGSVIKKALGLGAATTAGGVIGSALGGKGSESSSSGGQAGTGMLANAARAGSAGGGSLPSLRNPVRPSISASLSTNKLLTVAIDYLSSIDNSLKNQIDFQRFDYTQNQQSQKEVSFEQKAAPTSQVLSGAGEGLSKVGKSLFDTLSKLAIAGSLANSGAIAHALQPVTDFFSKIANKLGLSEGTGLESSVIGAGATILGGGAAVAGVKGMLGANAAKKAGVKTTAGKETAAILKNSLRKGLKTSLGIGVAFEAFDYLMGDKKVNANNLADSAGGIIGSVLGGALGSLLDPILGPFGTIGGAMAGGVIGKKLGSSLSDLFGGKVSPQNTAGGGQRPRPSLTTTPTGNITEYIASTEGFSSKAYWDNKQWSIGFGTKTNNQNEVIDRAEAMKRLKSRVGEDQSYVIQLSKKYNRNWNQNQIDALTSFSYNAGRGNLENLIAGGNRSDAEIAQSMLYYNRSKGKINSGLTRRRSEESARFLSGTAARKPSQTQTITATPSAAATQIATTAVSPPKPKSEYATSTGGNVTVVNANAGGTTGQSASNRGVPNPVNTDTSSSWMAYNLGSTVSTVY
jgi:GH24 family phage-related lysozyme (muramidase)